MVRSVRKGFRYGDDREIMRQQMPTCCATPSAGAPNAAAALGWPIRVCGTGARGWRVCSGRESRRTDDHVRLKPDTTDMRATEVAPYRYQLTTNHQLPTTGYRPPATSYWLVLIDDLRDIEHVVKSRDQRDRR